MPAFNKSASHELRGLGMISIPHGSRLGLAQPPTVYEHARLCPAHEARCFRSILRVLALPPPSQDSPMAGQEGLHLQEAGRAGHVAAASQPAGSGCAGRHGAGRRWAAGRAASKTPQPGPGSLPVINPRGRGKMVRGVLLSTYAGSFLWDECAPFVGEETEAWGQSYLPMGSKTLF